MNTEHIEQTLRDAGVNLTLDLPVGDVIERGNRLHRHRNRRLTMGGAGALAVGALGVAVVLPVGSNPIVAPAVASFSGAVSNLTPTELDQVSDRCRDAFMDPSGSGIGRNSWHIPEGTLPMVAEVRDGTALSYFDVGQTDGICTLERGEDGALRVSGLEYGAQESESLAAGRHLGFEILTANDPGDIGGQLADVAGVVRVSNDVADLTIEVDGQTIEGHITDGRGLFWLPDGLSPRAVDHMTVTARNAAGAVLEQHSLSSAEIW